jgi:leader peptidase (prepilin peptidase)/N-methyltransferase
MNILFLSLTVIFGLALGSFINALVWRLHKTESSIKNKKDKKYSILTGRSMCPNCQHKLSPLDLIPVVSWVVLKGKCRYCHKNISISYPLIEVLTTILFIFSYIYWPYNFNGRGIIYFVIWLFLLVGFISLAIYDIRWLTIPNKILVWLFSLVIIQILVTFIFYHGGLHYLLNNIVGFLIGGGIFYILFQLSSGKWIGGGDVKLGALLGLYLSSPTYAILLIFFASILGSLYSIPLLITGKASRKTLIPYGPFLIISTFILILFGSHIRSWMHLKGLYI